MLPLTELKGEFLPPNPPPLGRSVLKVEHLSSFPHSLVTSFLVRRAAREKAAKR